jgi:hypothetical protein
MKIVRLNYPFVYFVNFVAFVRNPESMTGLRQKGELAHKGVLGL